MQWSRERGVDACRRPSPTRPRPVHGERDGLERSASCLSPPCPKTAFASECVHPRPNVHARAHSHSHRHQGLSIYRPIIYGNTAVVLTPKEREALSTPDHTHRWTVAIRSAASAPDSDIVGGADDLSYFVKRVTFKLHDTYTNPNRSECVCDCSKLVCSWV